jgi:hypothetical protein
MSLLFYTDDYYYDKGLIKRLTPRISGRGKRVAPARSICMRLLLVWPLVMTIVSQTSGPQISLVPIQGQSDTRFAYWE